MAKKDATPVISMDAQVAEGSFTQLESRLQAIAEDQLIVVNIDLQRVAIAAAAVGRYVRQSEVRARFGKLPGDEFDIRHIDDLLPVSEALWYATATLASASVGKTGARLPVELVERAIALKQRVLRLMDYYLSDHPVAGPEILSIREGSGYIDLATDLFRLSNLHRVHDAVLQRDSKYYRADDAAVALDVSKEIFALMGETSDENQARWADLVRRTWTLLSEVYGEVRQAGTWLYRHESGAKKFPSLYNEGRSTRRRRPAKDSENPTGPSDPKELPEDAPSA